MLVLVKCPACAGSFRAAEVAVGKQMPCPQCGKPVKVEGPTVSPFDVFVSYSSKDKTIADAAVAVLESKRIRCWVAPRDIVAGKEWSESIIDGINQSRMMVLIFSENANTSQQVLREVERAVHRAIPIVPFRIENLAPSRSMEYFISTHHWLDAYHPPLEQHLEKLAATAEALLSGAAAPVKEGPKDFQALTQAAVRTLLARDNRLRVLLGAAALLLLVGGLIAASIIGGIYGLRGTVQPNVVVKRNEEPKATPEEVQAKADADILVEELRKLERGQGFAAKIQEVETDLRNAHTFFEQKDFSKAKELYATALTRCQALRDADNARQGAESIKSKVEKAREDAVAARAADFAPAAWTEATRKVEEGKKSFDAGDFAASIARSQEAVKHFEDARQVARVAGQGRLKALAFWTGFATGAIQCRVTVADKTKQNNAPDYIGLRKDLKLWADANSKIFWDTSAAELQVPENIVKALRDETDPKRIDSLLTKQLQADLRKRYGREIEAAYWMGRNLAFVEVGCTFIRRNDLVLGFFAQNIHGTLDYGAASAYTAGMPEVVTAALEQGRRIREEALKENRAVIAGVPHEALKAINHPLTQMRNEHVKDLNTATVTFARPRAVPPLPARQQEVVAEFVKLGAAFFFDIKPLRVVTIEFPKDRPGTTPIMTSLRELPDLEYVFLYNQHVTDQDVATLADFRKLERLILTGTKVGDAGMVHVGKLATLEMLTLDGLPVSDKGLEHLVGLTKLRELSLENMPNVTPAGIDMLTKALPNLKVKSQ